MGQGVAYPCGHLVDGWSAVFAAIDGLSQCMQCGVGERRNFQSHGTAIVESHYDARHGGYAVVRWLAGMGRQLVSA